MCAGRVDRPACPFAVVSPDALPVDVIDALHVQRGTMDLLGGRVVCMHALCVIASAGLCAH